MGWLARRTRGVERPRRRNAAALAVADLFVCDGDARLKDKTAPRTSIVSFILMLKSQQYRIIEYGISRSERCPSCLLLASSVVRVGPIRMGLSDRGRGSCSFGGGDVAELSSYFRAAQDGRRVVPLQVL